LLATSFIHPLGDLDSQTFQSQAAQPVAGGRSNSKGLRYLYTLYYICTYGFFYAAGHRSEAQHEGIIHPFPNFATRRIEETRKVQNNKGSYSVTRRQVTSNPPPSVSCARIQHEVRSQITAHNDKGGGDAVAPSPIRKQENVRVNRVQECAFDRGFAKRTDPQSA
jgi:hypothetical protein